AGHIAAHLDDTGDSTLRSRTDRLGHIKEQTVLTWMVQVTVIVHNRGWQRFWLWWPSIEHIAAHMTSAVSLGVLPLESSASANWIGAHSGPVRASWSSSLANSGE